MQPSIAEMTRPRAEIGTVIRGTQLPYDLHHAFAPLLARLHPEAHEQLFFPASGHSVFQSEAARDPSHPWWKGEKAVEVVQILEEALNECAPPGCFFGSHYGDDSDYGFWPHE